MELIKREGREYMRGNLYRAKLQVTGDRSLGGGPVLFLLSTYSKVVFLVSRASHKHVYKSGNSFSFFGLEIGGYVFSTISNNWHDMKDSLLEMILPDCRICIFGFA